MQIKPIVNRPDEAKIIKKILDATTDRQTQSSWTEEQIQTELDRSWGRGVYDENDQLVAFLFCREFQDELEVTNLGTDPQHRRKGLMKMLLAEAFKAFPSKTIWIEVHEKNDPALRLYESFRFQEVGRRRRYYRDGGDAILMKRKP